MDERFLLTSFHASSLEGNPLGAPVDRAVRVYLPPGYHASERRYPVVYLLHGYGGDADHAIVTTSDEFFSAYPSFVRLLVPLGLRSVVTYERLDALIERGVLPAFILVQPDGSLHLPQIHGGDSPSGWVRRKGSMYYDSPGTGNYASYVFEDLVEWADGSFRTRAARESRLLVGGSMGGYGALLGGIFYPDRFSRIAALSPSVCGLDVMDLDLYIPFLGLAVGREAARRDGRETVEDILDTCDLVFSPSRLLMPTVRRDAKGRAVEMDETARANWAAADAGTLAAETGDAFLNTSLRISCEQHDEFGFAGPVGRLHEQLLAAGIEHHYRSFSDIRARLISGHTLGIGLQVLPALRFVLTGDHGA